MPNRKGHTDLKNGHAVVDFAKGRNADVHPAGKFTAIETPKGKMLIMDNYNDFDKKTTSNVKKWLKLLGLMVIVLPFLANYVANLLGFQINWF